VFTPADVFSGAPLKWRSSFKTTVVCGSGFPPKLFKGDGALRHTTRVFHHHNIARHQIRRGKSRELIREGHWEYVDRVNASGAAIVVAVTTEQKVLLVEQFRIPVQARTIELPAGIIGDELGETNKSSAEAARRELLEETGYAAKHIEALLTGASCSGLTSERVTLFRATGLLRTGTGGGVAHEDITVHEVPLGEVVAWLDAKAKSGVLIDPKIYAGLFFVFPK
jgi:ADP-ribose pyrophosphatase